MLNPCVAVCTGLLASLTWAVKLETPTVVGVPVIAPLVELSVRPAGRLPLQSTRRYGSVPPLAANVAE